MILLPLVVAALLQMTPPKEPQTQADCISWCGGKAMMWMRNKCKCEDWR